MAAREEYATVLQIPTRWADNDIYGHVNNVEYFAFFDTVINEYLIRAGGLDIHNGHAIGLAVETMCRFHRPLTYPEAVDAGLRVGKLGNSSVRYEVGLFRAGEILPAATLPSDSAGRILGGAQWACRSRFVGASSVSVSRGRHRPALRCANAANSLRLGTPPP